MNPSDYLHAMTFGENGTYPKAMCGFKGGMKNRKRTCSPTVLLAQDGRDDRCPECLDAIGAPA